MNLLLDTHVLLWWLDDNPELPGRARDAIAEGKNNVFISAVSIWEIRIKESLKNWLFRKIFEPFWRNNHSFFLI